MPPYTIKLDRRIKKDLRSIPSNKVQQIKAAIANLANNTRPSSCKKLKGETNNYYRIRVGQYRIVYTIEDAELIILVIRIGHRSDIYKNL